MRLINHEDVARTVAQEFERLGISTNPQRFAFFEHSRPEKVLLPQVCYTAAIDREVQRQCIFVRKFGRVPTVVYVHQQKKGAPRSAGLCGTIWRSSEPKAEMMTRTSNSDKQLLALMPKQPEIAVAPEEASAGQAEGAQDNHSMQRRRLFIFSSRSDQ